MTLFCAVGLYFLYFVCALHPINPSYPLRTIKVAVPAGFTHDVMSVCRKDSQELTVEDRQALVETIRRVPNSSKFIVTHGSDTMIETAQYVAAAKGGVGH